MSIIEVDDDEDPRCPNCRKTLSRLARVCPRCAHAIRFRPAIAKSVQSEQVLGWYRTVPALGPRW